MNWQKLYSQHYMIPSKIFYSKHFHFPIRQHMSFPFWVNTVTLINVDDYAFLAFLTLSCHLEIIGIGVF